MSGAHRFSGPDDEPAITVRGLQVFVDAARAAPVREPQVSFDDIKAATEARLFRRRTGLAAVVATVAAAVVLSVNFAGAGTSSRASGSSPESGAVEAKDEASQVAALEDPSPKTGSEVVVPRADAETTRLASHIEIEGAIQATTLDAQTVQLATGEFAVVVGQTAARPLTVRFDAGLDEPRELIIQHGVLALDVSAEQRVVRLEQGVAAWRSPDGTVTPIEVETTGVERTAPAREAAKVDHAARLARAAEDQLAAGDRGAAMATLRTLVSKHPRAPESRAGLLDLARLEKAAGRIDASRCAYTLYLQRWPAGALSQDVERSLQRLGEGPACQGLRPKAR